MMLTMYVLYIDTVHAVTMTLHCGMVWYVRGKVPLTAANSKVNFFCLHTDTNM